MLSRDDVSLAQWPTPVEGRQGGKSNSFYKSERVMRGGRCPKHTLYMYESVKK